MKFLLVTLILIADTMAQGASLNAPDINSPTNHVFFGDCQVVSGGPETQKTFIIDQDATAPEDGISTLKAVHPEFDVEAATIAISRGTLYASDQNEECTQLNKSESHALPEFYI